MLKIKNTSSEIKNSIDFIADMTQKKKGLVNLNIDKMEVAN